MSDWFKNHTIGWLHEHDVDNLGHVISRETRVVVLPTSKKCYEFRENCIKKVLESFGCRLSFSLQPRRFQKKLEKFGLKVERRIYKNDDEWRSGVYIYRNNEIIAFVSEPVRVKEKKLQGGLIVIGGVDEWAVKTNVRL